MSGDRKIRRLIISSILICGFLIIHSRMLLVTRHLESGRGVVHSIRVMEDGKKTASVVIDRQEYVCRHPELVQAISDASIQVSDAVSYQYSISEGVYILAGIKRIGLLTSL